MATVITGANGHYGRLVLDALLARGVAPADLLATGRDPDRMRDIAERGITVRRADYDDPASLRDAFDGAGRLLLVSASDAANRVQQHRNAVDAVKAVGVDLVAYTSIVHADTATTILGGQHRATELQLEATGLPTVFLRNSWYLENYTAQIPTYLQYGIAGAAQDGRVSAATRQDYAEAAAAVLTTDGHQGASYELGGEAFTMAELADVVSAAAGRRVEYTDLSEGDYAQVLIGAGVPAAFAAILADADRGLSRGELFVSPDQLQALLGRPVTPWADVVRGAVKY